MAEDITQETLADAYFGLASLRERNRLGAWLRGITHRKCMDWHRSNRRHEPLLDQFRHQKPGRSHHSAESDGSEQLNEALQALSRPNRLVMTLRAEGLGNSQIADFLELPRNVIDNRIRRSRQQLRERIGRVESSVPELAPDLTGRIQQYIYAHRPLIATCVRVEPEHQSSARCTCLARARLLARRTDGVFRTDSSTSFSVLYGMERIHEEDVRRSVEAARHILGQPCRATSYELIGPMPTGQPCGRMPHLLASQGLRRRCL